MLVKNCWKHIIPLCDTYTQTDLGAMKTHVSIRCIWNTNLMFFPHRVWLVLNVFSLERYSSQSCSSVLPLSPNQRNNGLLFTRYLSHDCLVLTRYYIHERQIHTQSNSNEQMTKEHRVCRCEREFDTDGKMFLNKMGACAVGVGEVVSAVGTFTVSSFSPRASGM